MSGSRINVPRETCQDFRIDPVLTLWSAVVYFAIRDLWDRPMHSRWKQSSESLKENKRTALAWVYEYHPIPAELSGKKEVIDLSQEVQAWNSFDNILITLGWEVDIFHKQMLTLEGRKAILAKFNRQGFSTPSEYIDVIEQMDAADNQDQEQKS